MELNPITALSDSFNKLVIEHGSAIITEKNLAFLRDQLAIAEKEITKLTIRFETSESQNQNLRTQIQQLMKDNEELRSKIQKYEQPSHSNLLDEIEVKILLFLSKQQDELTDDDITQNLNINIQIVKFHLQELEKYSMVHADLYINSPCKWYLAQEGRRYLIENKLIS